MGGVQLSIGASRLIAPTGLRGLEAGCRGNQAESWAQNTVVSMRRAAPWSRASRLLVSLALYGGAGQTPPHAHDPAHCQNAHAEVLQTRHAGLPAGLPPLVRPSQNCGIASSHRLHPNTDASHQILRVLGQTMMSYPPARS